MLKVIWTLSREDKNRLAKTLAKMATIIRANPATAIKLTDSELTYINSLIAELTTR